MIIAIFLATLCALIAATLKWGARGALAGYMAGLVAAALIWPAFLGYAALKFGWGSEGYRYALTLGWTASASVGGAWAVCGLVAIFVAALAGMVLRLVRAPTQAPAYLDF